MRRLIGACLLGIVWAVGAMGYAQSTEATGVDAGDQSRPRSAKGLVR